jgi:hypothetical protein
MSAYSAIATLLPDRIAREILETGMVLAGEV